KRGQSLSSIELREFLKQQLPVYMIPSAFVELEALPLLPNGKIDRRALPAPDEGKVAEAQAFVAPRNPIEEVLGDIWTDVLKLKQIDIHANFFEIGGHSLLAIRVIARIRTAFQVELPVRCLFESPTIAD